VTLGLVAFDMDGTLVDVESSWAAVHAHFGDHNVEGLRRFSAGEIDDLEFLRTDVRIWHKHRPDLRYRDLVEILSKVPLMPGAHRLFDALHGAGVPTAIVSGGIDVLAERIAGELRIGRVLANGFATDPEGRITGDGIIRVPIHGKEKVLRALQEEVGVAPSETASVGNSEIDVGLFKRSRIGIAFHPEDDDVRRAATHVVEGKDLGELVGILLG
jgi:phosphoserine phosphatase